MANKKYTKSCLSKILCGLFLSGALMACDKPVGGNGGNTLVAGDCGDCPAGMMCHNGSCEQMCNKPRDCGNCYDCVSNFCVKLSDFCVIRVEPANGEENVSETTQTMNIYFSSDVSADSVNNKTVGLTRNTDKTLITSAATVNGSVVTLNIETYLTPASSYTIWVDKLVQSTAMNFLSERYESIFSTINKSSGPSSPTGYNLVPAAGHMEGGKYTLDIVGGPVAGEAGSGNKNITVTDGFWN